MSMGISTLYGDPGGDFKVISATSAYPWNSAELKTPCGESWEGKPLLHEPIVLPQTVIDCMAAKAALFIDTTSVVPVELNCLQANQIENDPPQSVIMLSVIQGSADEPTHFGSHTCGSGRG